MTADRLSPSGARGAPSISAASTAKSMRQLVVLGFAFLGGEQAFFDHRQHGLKAKNVILMVEIFRRAQEYSNRHTTK